MPTESILIVIGAAIIVNLVIMAALLMMLIGRRRQRFAAPNGFAEPSAYRLAQATDTPAPGGSAGSATPTPAEPGRQDETRLVDGSEATASTIRPVMADEDARAVETASFMTNRADQLEPLARDPQTGLDGSMTWETRIREEDARHGRYRRPVSVVLVELDGLDRLVDRFGQDAADRLIPPVGQTLQRQARAVDQIARLGSGRFAVLLPETDEVQAINYVERVRAECDRWLAAGAVAMRLAIGWASPHAGSDLGAAVRVAEDRLNADRRRPSFAGDVRATPPEDVEQALQGQDQENYPSPGPLPIEGPPEST